METSACTINANGELTYFHYSEAEEVIIPSGVRVIYKNVFRGQLPYCKRVIIPEGVETIEEGAFAHCDALEQVVLPSSLKTINASAFAYCRNLTDINLENVSYLGDAAFSGAKKLLNIDLRSLEAVGCDSLCETGWYEHNAKEDTLLIAGKVLISAKHITGIGVMIPAEVSFIAPYAFMESEIIGVIFMNKNTVFGEYAFAHSKIEEIVLPNLKVIPRGCFTESNIKVISLPHTLRVIDKGAFSRCELLEIIRIPENVTCIEEAAFYGCTALKSLIFASRKLPLHIGTYAFMNCPNLLNAKLPKEVGYMPYTKTPYKIFDEHVDVF